MSTVVEQSESRTELASPLRTSPVPSNQMSDACPSCRNLTWLETMARRGLHSRLNGITGGTIRVGDTEGYTEFGSSASGGIDAEWTIKSPEFYRHAATGGSLGVAESYLQGHWETDDLTALLRLLCRNLNRISGAEQGLASLGKLLARVAHWADRNTRRGSLNNISRHYDLGNEFFQLFLDPTLMYSSAFFETDASTLHDASIAKLDRICRKLDLQPSDNVLEIGTGWGGFALHSVQNYGCSLTTTTISQEQLSKATQRVEAAGISDRVRLLDADYRDLTGQFDKLVSIEMIEAVGAEFLDDYFKQCGRLLKPGGRFVLQGIVMPEQRYESYRRSVDFIQKYIFPGGFLPSVSAIQDSVGRTSSLRLESVEDLSPHYARTLSQWRSRFFERIDDVRALGFDDRFIRMWEYYFCYCEAAFREQAVGVVQMVWDQPEYAG